MEQIKKAYGFCERVESVAFYRFKICFVVVFYKACLTLVKFKLSASLPPSIFLCNFRFGVLFQIKDKSQLSDFSLRKNFHKQ